MSTSYLNRYRACMLLHALGDTIGFKNSEWEFMKTRTIESKVLEKLYEYIDLGGINYVPQKEWLISDDSIMHMMVAKGLLTEFETVNSFGKNLVKYFIKAYDYFVKDNNIRKRYPGITLLESLKRLKEENGQWDDMKYDFYAGGSGASMRNSCIGLAFHNQKDKLKLIQMAIESSRITHNSSTGYLGGMVSALFTSYAINNIYIKKWPFMLMELFNDSTIDKYIRNVGRDKEQYFRDSHIFIEKWSKYIEDKFDDNDEPINRRSNRNLIHRTKYYYDNFAFADKPDQFFPGGGGDDSVIIAFDCLIDSNGSWEKLVIYSMLHGGDTDTTGSIAASWYGAFYGFGDVPEHRIDLIENKNKFDELGKKLFYKYYNKK